MNENLKPVEKLTPFTKMIMTIGTLPSSFYASMSYYESMVWLYEYLKNQVIPVVDNNAEAVEELQEAFITLKEWIENYFENLNIQEEINHKLDEMAEDGTLADMIAEYIKMQGQLVYNSVADMKEAENIQNGSFLKTYGFYSYNDGGGALYKARTVTNEDVIDNMTIIALYDNTLVAELIVDECLNIKQLGAYGNNNNDDTDYFKKAIEITNNIYIPNGSYKISDTIIINGNIKLKADGNIVSYVTRTKPVFLIKNKYNEISFNDIVDNLSYNNENYEEGWHGWENEDYTAIKLDDFSYSTLKFNRIANFTSGIIINAKTELGTYKSLITGFNIFNCKNGILTVTNISSWFNNCKINDIMISFGSSSSEFIGHITDIQKYGIIQKDIDGDHYGLAYMNINNMFFETAVTDNFTGFSFNLISKSTFNHCIPEISNSSIYANFTLKYYPSTPVTPENHSYKNKFIDCYVMGGNNNILFNNVGKALCSLNDIASHDNIELNEIYREDKLLGKLVKIDNNHMSIRGYSFAPINNTAINIETCQIAKSDYSYITNDFSHNCLNIGTTTPLTLILPCEQYDTFKIILNEKGISAGTNGTLEFKCYDSSGNLLDGAVDGIKKLAGYLDYNANTKNLRGLSGQLNNVEFTVIDNTVKHILVYVYGNVNGFILYKYGKPVIVRRFGNNLQHLNLLGDVAFSNVIPTSTSDTESVFKNQKVYNSNSANIGEYWTFDGTNWS